MYVPWSSGGLIDAGGGGTYKYFGWVNIGTMVDDTPTVLIVEDEPKLVDTYSTWLEDSYDVRTAHEGREALDKFDEDVEVVLLDRVMPEMSGEEVLEKIRDSGVDCRVAMITAIEPDFDILDMGFDDYISKPVLREDLNDVVERMLRRATYESQVQECFALASKVALLESTKTKEDLKGNEKYAELKNQLKDLMDELQGTLSELDDEDFDAVFHEITR